MTSSTLGDGLKDIERIISELEDQKAAIDRAITALREITGQTATIAKRTRQAASKPATKKRRLSAAGRERIAEALRRRWAAKRSAQAAGGEKKQSSGRKAASKKSA